MARQVRQISSTGIYHVMFRGINLQNIFSKNIDYDKFLKILQKYADNGNYKIYAYCLMNNHIHLLIQEDMESISNSMKRIGVSYVSWYNWQYSRKGHLFQDRFKSEAIEDDIYFLTVLRYIHQNPVKAGLTKNVNNYKWNSYNEYVKKNMFVDTEYGLSLFSENYNKSLQEFKKFHEENNDDECLDIQEKKRTISDGEIEQIIYNKYNIDIGKLHSLKKDKQDEIFRELKEKGGSSLRQLSRLTGFTVHRIYKA